MSLTAAVNAPPPTARFAAFLAAAVLLHALFLLLPAQRELQPGPPLHRLSVSLQAVMTHRPAQDTVPAPPAPAPASEPVRSTRTAPGPRSTPDLPAAPPQPAGEASPPELSTARLLDHANRLRWTVPDNEQQRRLGVPAPAPRPKAGWPGGAAQARDNGGSTAPAGLEVVERWLAADGSHNVLIRTPSGGMLCGRAERWDPLQPLVEHVMMLRDCGSGEPTFEWPESRRAETPPP